MDHLGKAKRYRDQAEEFRAKSDLMGDPETRAQYSRMADAYDKLAEGQDKMACNMMVGRT